MTGSKLEAMAIYLVRQACGNDILASVYIFIDHTMHILLFIVSALILKVSLVRAISAESQKLDYVSFPGGGVQHAD